MAMQAEALPLPTLIGAPEDQAEQWLTYLYSGETTADGENAFKRWLGTDPAHAGAFRRSEQMWRDLAVIAEEHADCVAPRDLGGLPKPQSQSRSFVSRRAALAASLAGAIMFGAATWRFAMYDATTTEHFASAVSEIKTVELQDGSKITLGGRTSIDVTFKHESRQVELLRGGAYFDVAHDPDRPFTVRAATTAVTVLGTEFDIRKGGQEVRVAVAEGVVTVAQVGEKSESIDRAALTLGVGKQVTAFNGILGEINEFDAEATLAWREGRLIYQNEKLSNVITEINRYRSSNIRLADDALGDIRISIALPIDRTDTLLTALEATEPVDIFRGSSGVTVRLQKAGQ